MIFPTRSACRPCILRCPGVTHLRPLQRTRFERAFASKATETFAPPPPTAKNNRAHAIATATPPAPKPFAKSDGKPFKPAPLSQAFKPLGNAPPTPTSGRGYPERLLIYHAGTGRLVFISSFKLTAIFIFIFSSLLIAPGYYYSAYEATWMAPAVVIGGAVPMLVMMFTTAPFVAYVHLALPIWARASQPRLMRYVQNLPSTATLDVTSVRWIWPRVTRLHASELYVHRSKIGAMTIRRNVPEIVSAARQWWQWRPLTRFYVSGKGGKTSEPGVWEQVIDCIVRASNKKDVRPKIRVPPLQ